jgi:hypothetical protein
MALPRCIFTVTSLLDNSFATRLFVSLDPTSTMICRSPGVSSAYRSRNSAIPCDLLAPALVHSDRSSNGFKQIPISYWPCGEFDCTALRGHANFTETQRGRAI